MKLSKINITVDIVVFTTVNGELSVLLIKRKIKPYQGSWAIPGGFVRENETLDAAAYRELQEETGVKPAYLEQLYTFGDPKRDPRGHTVTVTYMAILSTVPTLQAATDAAEAKWFNVYSLPALAFDHKKILTYALERLRNKLEYTTAGFHLLTNEFTLTELQQVYETVLNKKLDKRNFRRKINLLDILTPLKKYKTDSGARPAQLFKLSTKKFQKLKEKGILFPF